MKTVYEILVNDHVVGVYENRETASFLTEFLYNVREKINKDSDEMEIDVIEREVNEIRLVTNK